MSAVLAPPPPVLNDAAGLLAPLAQRLADEPALAQRAGEEFGVADLAAALRAGLEPGRVEGLLDLVCRVDGDAAAALQLAHGLPLQALGAVGLVLASAADSGELLTDLQRYWPLLQIGGAALLVRPGADAVELHCRAEQPLPAGRRAAQEYSLFCVLRLLRSVYGDRLPPGQLAGFDGQPRKLALWQAQHVLEPLPGEAAPALRFPASLLQQAVGAANPALRARLRPSLEAALQQRQTRRDWTARVRDHLLAAGPAGWSEPRVAAALGLTIAALRQHLAAEDNSVEAIVDALRRERALSALLVSDVPSIDLVHALGFLDRAAFERQFRAWFQTTPTSLRNDAMAAGIDARRGAAAELDHLPPAPQTCRTLIALRYLEDAALADIVAAVAADPALSARVMGLASSAFYGARRVRDLHDAIGRVLGLNELIRLATVLAAKGALQPQGCPAFDLLAFWSRSLAVAQAAGDLLREAGVATDIEEARLLGLFHDLGLLVLAYRAGPRLQQHLEALPEGVSEAELRRAELRRLGTSRHIAGSILLAHWGLPPDTVRALRWMDHHVFDPHADLPLPIRLIVALSRYFRRRYASLPVAAELEAVLQVFADAGLASPWEAEALAQRLDEVLEARRMQAEELLAE
jgi:HD-like signal output (HDOD) protein/AraC-like DNA-binding protein